MQRNLKVNSHKANYSSSKWLPAALTPLLIAALAACSTLESPEASQTLPDRYDYSLSVTVTPGANRADVEAQYGGAAVVWRPEAGFAVLGLQDTGGLVTLGAKDNKKAFKSPEVAANGVDGNGVDGNGRTSWSGGRTSWSGGRTSWSGGRTSWSGGVPTTFAENVTYWNQVDLPEGQALAPHLGAGVKVAVIDTGIDLRHPAFQGRLAPASEWKDFVDGDTYPQEMPGTNYGHGTGVADVIVQVAPNVTILPLRVLGPDGSGDTTDVVAAIDYAIQKGVAVINLSLGTDSDEKALKELVKYAVKQQVLVVASAGNNGREEILFPARYTSEVLSIGSVDRYDELSSFSAFGKQLSLTAPGEFVYTAAPDRSVVSWSGTSFAAPIVAGTAALALGESSSYAVKPQDISKLLTGATDDVRGKGRNNRFKADQLGKGRLDIDDFLQAAFKK